MDLENLKNIPYTETRELCDAERFIKGLSMLIDICNVNLVSFDKYGIMKFMFCDGSSVGSLTAFMDGGYIDKKLYNEKYKKNEKG